MFMYMLFALEVIKQTATDILYEVWENSTLKIFCQWCEAMKIKQTKYYE